MVENERLELAEEHVKIAEQLLNEEAKNCENNESGSSEKTKALMKGQLNLEKAETEIEDAEAKK